MVFSSIVFLIYFLPIFLLLYYIVDKKYKNIILLISSIIFYSWGAPRFIFVILGTTFIDFHLVKWMSVLETNFKRRILLTFSVCLNLGLLFYFKYSNFFIENVNAAIGVLGVKPMAWTKLILPIGISFYTFETMTYVVDVYRRIHKPLHNFWEYQLYIILFPKLIAGPIIRYNDISDQITDRSANDTVDMKLTGFYRFVIGLSKKVIIANTMGELADNIFALDYHNLSTSSAWIGILAYTFQIYFDFSGYSDMAIGIGKMIGFRLTENFNNPYTSQSITEFWRRWHITLGNWMRNYLYIPLGGNKVKTKRRLYFNLWFVFLASGLWHGASWSFVIWGAYHGFFLVIERIFLLDVYKKIGRIPSTVLTFFFVVIGWVFFRIEKVKDALLFLKRMFVFQGGVSYQIDRKYIFTFAVAALFSFFIINNLGKKIQTLVYSDEQKFNRHIALTVVSLFLLIISISSITASDFNPFIYFRF